MLFEELRNSLTSQVSKNFQKSIKLPKSALSQVWEKSCFILWQADILEIHSFHWTAQIFITSTHPLKKQENTTITSLPWLNFGGISVMYHGSWRGGLSFSTFQVEVTVNSWSVSVLNINKVTQKIGYICQRFFFCFFYSVVVAWGSLWTVDQQLSLSDKLPAREKEREQKKDEWNKEQANSAVWLRRAPFHSKKQAEEGGGRSQQNGNGRVLVGGRG